MDLKKQFKKQQGAAMLILALIISMLTAITVLGVTKLTIEEKKRVKSTALSANAYRKADEAAECSLWGRNAILETCSDETLTIDAGTARGRYFPKDIKNYYCSNFSDEIKLFHLLTAGTAEEVLDCTGPLWITKFSTEGEEQSSGSFVENSIKKRGVGVTVHTSRSSIFEPFVCCNKIAYQGFTKKSYIPNASTCGPEFTDDQGPDDGNRGWLGYWPSCASTCLSDECAYYDTTLDDNMTILGLAHDNSSVLNCNNPLYEITPGESHTYNLSQCQGAHWCWTEYEPTHTTFATGSMCDCLSKHSTDVSTTPLIDPTSDMRYWIHPDVINEEVCSPCHRIYIEDVDNPLRPLLPIICGGEGEIGIWCYEIWKQEQDYIATYGEDLFIQFFDDIWGIGGRPPVVQPPGQPHDYAYRLTLKENRAWMCNCDAFYGYTDGGGSKPNKAWCDTFCTPDMKASGYNFVWCDGPPPLW